ncbi:MAG: hypothetical protein ACR2HJ_03685 [Fimbriimonadales bacterium]
MGTFFDAELERILEESDQEDLLIRLVAFRKDSEDLKLLFDVKQLAESVLDTSWLITASGVCDFRLVPGQVDGRGVYDGRRVPGESEYLEVSDDNPLLWYYTARTGCLSIRGKVESPFDVLKDLAREHNTALGSYRESVTNDARCLDVLAAGYGILADGPLPLLSIYESVLVRNGIECTILESEVLPVFEKKLALLIYNGYVIADWFESEKIM